MKSVKKIFVPTIYLIAILSVVGCILLTIMSINKYLTESEKFDYSINGLIDNEVKPVQGEDNTKNNVKVIKPFRNEKVTIGRGFYDFEGEQTNQEKSIIFYENTYMQNSGVDYVSDEVFDVISVLAGKVISVDTDEVLGNIVKIEHDKNIITTYQGIDKVALKVGDVISQGTIVGVSGKSLVNSNYTTSLHFEVNYKGELIDPEKFYSLNVNEL
ncbi:spoIIQ [Clostridium sp. CAG:628]|mgnify:FL=1|nr:spoIIQ [Clostridium sp. CAG:628]